MKGTILDYSVRSNTGYISGDDNQRYSFSGADWRASGTPDRGRKVDFATEGNHAKDIFLAVGATGSAENGGKNRMTAGLLALFLGGLGVHKFYLGYNTQGIIMLVLFWTLIPAIIALIEGIAYLSKTDEEFQNIYVLNKKFWF